jgi:hypothetical protein
MFLRCNIRKKDGKTHHYWSVVENRRLAEGRIVQRHVLYLGEINPGVGVSRFSRKAGMSHARWRWWPQIATSSKTAGRLSAFGLTRWSSGDLDNGVPVGWIVNFTESSKKQYDLDPARIRRPANNFAPALSFKSCSLLSHE